MRFIFVLSILLIFSTILPAQWHNTGYGKWTVTKLASAPFAGFDTSDPALNDSSIYLFIPAGYRPGAKIDFIIDHHGHGAIVDPDNGEKASFAEFCRSDYQLFISRKNAILVMPQAARNRSNSSAGNFAQPGGLEKLMTDVIEFLKTENQIGADATLGDIHLNSFSGGYRITAMDLAGSSEAFLPHIRSVHLWDSFYAEKDIYFDFACRDDFIFCNTFTPSGGTTGLSRQLDRYLRENSVAFDSLTVPQSAVRHRGSIYTKRGHGDVMAGGATYARHLRTLPLEDISITAPEFLAAIPQNDGIKIHWRRESNRHLAGFRLWGKQDGPWQLLAAENLLDAAADQYLHRAIGRWQYRLESVAESGSKKISRRIFAANATGDTTSLLIVDGEYRRLVTGLHGFNPADFLWPAKPGFLLPVCGTVDRAFAVVSAEALENDRVSWDQFSHIIWLAGEQGRHDKIIDYPQQKWLTQFLESGGNLLLSGKNLAHDLASFSTSKPDRDFATRYFGVSGTAETDKPVAVRIGQFTIQTTDPQFERALQPLAVSETGAAIVSFMKRDFRIPPGAVAQIKARPGIPANYSSTMAVTLDLADKNRQKEFQFLMDQFFRLALTAGPTPAAPVLPQALYLTDGKLHLAWPPANESLVLNYFDSTRTLVLSDTGEYPPLIHNFGIEPVFLRLSAGSGKLFSQSSQLLGSLRHIGQKRRVLIVNGFDRTGAGNTGDSVFETGDALNRLGYDFDTATNEAIIDGICPLKNYPLVVWMLGDESTVDEAFSTAEQSRISAYLASGGKLLASGSEAAWDLVAQAGSESDSSFFFTTFSAGFASDSAPANHIFFSDDSIAFGVKYPVPYPDALTVRGAGNGLLRYNDGSIAAVGNSLAVIVGFPLETIGDAEERARIFGYLIEFLTGETP
jgi:hypothetical protein